MRNLSKSKALVEAAGRSLGRTLEIKQLDVCDENSIKACVDGLPERRVDILSKPTPVGSVQPEKATVDILQLQLQALITILAMLDFLSQ